jgi:hypothetical protein
MDDDLRLRTVRIDELAAEKLPELLTSAIDDVHLELEEVPSWDYNDSKLRHTQPTGSPDWHHQPRSPSDDYV